MRVLSLLSLVSMALLPMMAAAQTPAPPAQKPPAQTPPAPAPGNQTPAQPAQPAAPAAAPVEIPRSLFDPSPRQFQVGARVSSISGDPARWQRYEDLGDGLLFTDARYESVSEATGRLYRVTADKVGWRDQRFTGLFERPGFLRVSGYWDEIPQFYSVDTATAYTSTEPGVLTMPDATQLAIQNGQANLNAYVPISPQFDLRERRDIGVARFIISPSSNLDLSATYRMQRHVGELPWGASFGFSNDVEVPLPYNSRTNDFNIGAEWTNQRNMLRVAYDGSWFENHDDTLVWDNPLRRDDGGVDLPGRGRTALWPSNQAHTVSLGGFTKLSRRTQITGFVSTGVWSNDSTLQPFTINATLPTLALPRAATDGEARIFSTNLSLVSRPWDRWRLSARLRVYDFSNETPHAAIPQYVSYDSHVSDSLLTGPEVYAHNRQTFTADATWTGLPNFALGVGYTHNGSGYDFRIFEDTSEDVVTLTADAVGLPGATVRAQLEIADRTGSGLDEALLVQIGEQPAMRHYDVADRSRTKFTGQFDFLPGEKWALSLSGGWGRDDYDNSYFGLQETSFELVGFGVDYQHPTGLGAGGSYNYEHYFGFQQSRSASPGEQAADPRRDWTTDSSERVHYFSFYVTPPRFGRNTEARLTYDIADARATYIYGLAPGSTLTPPQQLPEAYNKLQDLRLDVRHRLNARLALTFAYRYEPSRVYDFALDPSVVNSIVQPSSLVLGYVYRPYTTHSGVLGLLYAW